MTFKDIFPGLSRSWNFQEKKIQDFPGGVGTVCNLQLDANAPQYRAVSETTLRAPALSLLFSSPSQYNWTYSSIAACLSGARLIK